MDKKALEEQKLREACPFRPIVDKKSQKIISNT